MAFSLFNKYNTFILYAVYIGSSISSICFKYNSREVYIFYFLKSRDVVLLCFLGMSRFNNLSHFESSCFCLIKLSLRLIIYECLIVLLVSSTWSKLINHYIFIHTILNKNYITKYNTLFRILSEQIINN
jgi:hypothetical protein